MDERNVENNICKPKTIFQEASPWQTVYVTTVDITIITPANTKLATAKTSWKHQIP